MTLKNDRYAYRVIWSNSDQEYVGLCKEFRPYVMRSPEQWSKKKAKKLEFGFGLTI